ncbi:MAG TPA: glucosidase [Burkholderiales bacterium]|nr:glucosidase [Burkholderiales bacterium]
MNKEQERLLQSANTPWKKWGPYLSERQWGTVREDYSQSGDAWGYFTHDQARSRAYRWGEDGLAGISDWRQQLCFGVALWNTKDPILKERLFGVVNSEGNHGEDVKEYYFYLDSTPTHSYMKYLYKYPQAAFPYGALIETNRRRGREEFEYELLDTGVFGDDRYFDVFVEYAKKSPEDLLIQITAHNRGPDRAPIHIVPTLWFRNTWFSNGHDKPMLRAEGLSRECVLARHEALGDRYLYVDTATPWLFTDNETNTERLYGRKNASRYVKDGINDAIVQGRADCVNPDGGTKAAANYRVEIGPHERAVVRLRLTDVAPSQCADAYSGNGGPFGPEFDETLAQRVREANEFYADITPRSMSADAARVMRQALAGMLWSKQYYFYDVHRWLGERGSDPFKPDRRPAPRNDSWSHMYNADIISMPDKWEYPWYAAWDLGFHVLALTLVDPDFGKEQLELILQDRYLHPNGQVPAYEWNFGDVNPPVHAWATMFTYTLERLQRGQGDIEWLKRMFDKLLMNFTWWVNRKDREGRNVFEGGFLGLDNISVFDRSAPLPTGGCLEQSDGTAWMALFCQTMTEISAELTRHDPARVDMVLKFVQHFLWIASAMNRPDAGMWDEEDGFFYDVLRLPDGRATRLKVRSLVGLLPMCAATVFDGDMIAKMPELRERFRRFIADRPELLARLHDLRKPGYANRLMLSIVDSERLRRILAIMLDEKEFLSPYGIRSLSRRHAEQPYVFHAGGNEYRVDYLPAESNTGMFGGNSNWRGPIWMPINALIVRSLLHYYRYYGPDFKIECPTGSGQFMTLYGVAQELARRLGNIFVRGVDGSRPVYGGTETFQNNPHWRDYVQFYEYFHGDNGAGLGASHQTGWTGIVARLMHLFASVDERQILEKSRAELTKHAATKQSAAHP